MSDFAPPITVSGDVQGLPLGSQIVTALQGRPVADTVPALGQVLGWGSNKQWTPLASGMRIAVVSRNASPTTTGTTFSAGTDLLASAISLPATGSNDYIFRLFAAGWALTTTAASLSLHLNLDGADANIFAQTSSETANAVYPCSGAAYIAQPAAGTHTVNARLVVGSGTGTVFGASASGYMPIIATLEYA